MTESLNADYEPHTYRLYLYHNCKDKILYLYHDYDKTSNFLFYMYLGYKNIQIVKDTKLD